MNDNIRPSFCTNFSNERIRKIFYCDDYYTRTVVRCKLLYRSKKKKYYKTGSTYYTTARKTDRQPRPTLSNVNIHFGHRILCATVVLRNLTDWHFRVILVIYHSSLYARCICRIYWFIVALIPNCLFFKMTLFSRTVQCFCCKYLNLKIKIFCKETQGVSQDFLSMKKFHWFFITTFMGV